MMTITQEKLNHLWGLRWHSQNRRDGVRKHLLYTDGIPLLFPKRDVARIYAQTYFGHLKTRRDLRTEPHGWRMPRPVKILSFLYADPEGH